MPTVKGILILILLLLTFVLEAQTKKRLRPGTMYAAGEHVYAARYGFTGTIPEGWQGTLPHDSEIFLLLPDTHSTGGEIFTFASISRDTGSIREAWMNGVNLSETILIKSKGSMTTEGDMISSEVIAISKSVNYSYKAFVAARCSPYGHCIISLAIGDMRYYDQMKVAVEDFMRNATFSEPSSASVYAGFNWQEFLSNKSLISFMTVQNESGRGTKDNIIHLCGNGTFKTRIKKKGSMKQFNSSYKGNLSGTWVAEGIGEHGILKLTFKKQPPVEVLLLLKDDKIFANDERYFAAHSDQCDEDS